jgi:hypothetical protein
VRAVIGSAAPWPDGPQSIAQGTQQDTVTGETRSLDLFGAATILTLSVIWGLIVF